jgi:Zn-finger nucleic acid-binding protein
MVVCPTCQTRMETQEFQGISVEICDQCNGVWFDKNEVAPYLRRVRASRAHPVPDDSNFRTATSTSPLECPKCGRAAYTEAATRGSSYGACQSCLGLFLPRNTILRFLSESPDRFVVSDPVDEGISESMEAWSWMLMPRLMIASELFKEIWQRIGTREGPEGSREHQP